MIEGSKSSFFALGLEDGHVPTFWLRLPTKLWSLLAALPRPQGTSIKGLMVSIRWSFRVS